RTGMGGACGADRRVAEPARGQGSQTGESVDVAGSSSSHHAVRRLAVRDDAVLRSVVGARDSAVPNAAADERWVHLLPDLQYANGMVGDPRSRLPQLAPFAAQNHRLVRFLKLTTLAEGEHALWQRAPCRL